MGLEIYDPRQGAQAVRRELRLDQECPPFEACFELIRATIWSLAKPPEAVHIGRILSVALPAWRLLSKQPRGTSEALRAELREALSTLEVAGDLVELAGGYWASATARFVKLPEGAGYLLVGGVPTSALPPLQNPIEYHGPHRHFSGLPSQLNGLLPVEDLFSWARLPQSTLEAWAAELIASLEWQSFMPTSTDAFEFYVPTASSAGTPQFKRWSNAMPRNEHRLLARRVRIYGAREFRMIETSGGRIAKVCDLQGLDVRRLMYALDHSSHNQVRARTCRIGSRAEWHFTSELPRAERRVLAAIGTLSIPDERPYERVWTITRNQDLATRMVQDLGIRIISTAEKN